MTRLAGVCRTHPKYSAISVTAQIILRTKPFMSKLAAAYNKRSDVIVLAMFMDLHAQLHCDPDEIDINPLIHDYDMGGLECVNAIAYWTDVVTRIQAAVNLDYGYDSLFPSTVDEAYCVIHAARRQKAEDAWTGQNKTLMSGKIAFFTGEELTADKETAKFGFIYDYSLYAVVCERKSGYRLFLKDEKGWLSITEEEVVTVRTWDRNGICILGYIKTELVKPGGWVESIRPEAKVVVNAGKNWSRPNVVVDAPVVTSEPVGEKAGTGKYSMTVNQFDAVTMLMNISTAYFNTREGCLKAVREATELYEGAHVYYQYDKDETLQDVLSRFDRSVTVVIDPTQKKSLVKDFLKSKQVELTIECFAVPQLSMDVRFDMRQNSDDIKDFVKRFATDILRLHEPYITLAFRDTCDEWQMGYSPTSVAAIKDSGSVVVFGTTTEHSSAMRKKCSTF